VCRVTGSVRMDIARRTEQMVWTEGILVKVSVSVGRIDTCSWDRYDVPKRR
jgi:hypothetical protein